MTRRYSCGNLSTTASNSVPFSHLVVRKGLHRQSVIYDTIARPAQSMGIAAAHSNMNRAPERVSVRNAHALLGMQAALFRCYIRTPVHSLDWTAALCVQVMALEVQLERLEIPQVTEARAGLRIRLQVEAIASWPMF